MLSWEKQAEYQEEGDSPVRAVPIFAYKLMCGYFLFPSCMRSNLTLWGQTEGNIIAVRLFRRSLFSNS